MIPKIKKIRQLMSLIKFDLKNYDQRKVYKRFSHMCKKHGTTFMKDALIFFAFNFHFDLPTAGLYLNIYGVDKKKADKLRRFMEKNVIHDEYATYIVDQECREILGKCQNI